SSFSPALGELVKVTLLVGHPQEGAEPVARNPERLVEFSAESGSSRRPVLGQDGVSPAGLLRTEAAGLETLLYQSNQARSELPADRFERYLAEKGLDSIVAARQAAGQSDRPGRELYSRCLKALLAVAGHAPAEDRPHGLPLELVARGPLASSRPGREIPLELLFHGKPLGDAHVEWVRLDGSGERVRARTDARGRVVAKLASPGPWLVTAVVMVPAAPGSDADWESFWASLTFELPGPDRA
nr:DUF4198 domain-containing protein [Thermoanaerobaculia bacterium]